MQCVSLKKYKPLNARKNSLLAYILQFGIKMRYAQGKINRVADALSRLLTDINTNKIHAYNSPEHLKDEKVILAVTKPIKDSNTDKLTTDCKRRLTFEQLIKFSTTQQKTRRKNYTN